MKNLAIPSFELEVCVDRVSDAVEAEAHGATRIELNMALPLDGLTPTLGMCSAATDALQIPFIAMLRPHANGFHYDRRDRLALLRDCESILSTGAAGIAFGSLTEEGHLDWPLLKEVSRLCGPKEFVLHRAFDELKNDAEQLEALDRLIEYATARILTSGRCASATEGVAQLQKLVHQAGTRIAILVGSGVNSGNIQQLRENTGSDQFHGSFTLGQSQLQAEDVARARAILEQCYLESDSHQT